MVYAKPAFRVHTLALLALRIGIELFFKSLEREGQLNRLSKANEFQNLVAVCVS